MSASTNHTPAAAANTATAVREPAPSRATVGDTSDKLSYAEKQLVAEHRDRQASRLKAVDLQEMLRAYRDTYGQEIPLTSASWTSIIGNPELANELRMRELLKDLDEARRERDAAHVEAEAERRRNLNLTEKAIFITAAVSFVSLIYGVVVGNAGGRESMRAEALQAAGPLAKLLARRLAK